MIPAGIEFLKLSPAQVSVIQHSVNTRTTCLAGGAVRSGKSFAVMISYGIWLLSQEKRCDAALIAQSVESGWRNLGRDLAEFINSVDGCSAELDRGIGFRLIIRGLSEVNLWFFGGADVKSRKRIQGATLRGLCVEEASLLPKEFFWQSWARLSEENSKMWASYNPDGGNNHWFKKEVIDAAGSFDAEVVNFQMSDNPSLSQNVIDRYMASFQGVYYKRYIDGLWAAAEGVIYPDYKVTDEDKIDGGTWCLAMDWGVSTVLAVLAIHARGTKAIVSHELKHDGRVDGIINEREAVKKIVTWFKEIAEIKNTTIYLDPHTPASTKKMLRAEGFNIRNASNAVRPGIVVTQTRLAHGEIKINGGCENLLLEMSSYVFDDAASARGVDQPLPKQDDHFCDAVRYYCFSTGAIARPMTVRSAIG